MQRGRIDMKRKLTFLWFLLGLGIRLQVIASLSITEIIVLVAAPFLCIKDYRQMKKDGVAPFFILSIMVIIGCIIASISNHTPPQYVLRGLAVTCIVTCSIVVAHWILHKDPAGFKWFVLAVPLSTIISTFYFKASVEMTMLGTSSEEIMSGPIFWINRLTPLVMAPTKGWYVHMPVFVNVLAPLGMGMFAILTSASGRSSALALFALAVMVMIGGVKSRSISRISRHFWAFCIGGIVFIFATYCVYRISASQGWLGDEARKKYEVQTEGGSGGIGRLLLGGRGGSFVGLLACRDKPIVGWGPWAMDEGGYSEEFIRRFGTRKDVEDLINLNQWRMKFGITNQMIGCHSYITEFWLWYGIWGLVFWLYVIFALLRYLKQDVAAVPQWYAWLACSIPSVFWNMFFSPFSARFDTALFVVACLMVRAVRMGRYRLPMEMVREMR